jgi:hypothetical protein
MNLINANCTNAISVTVVVIGYESQSGVLADIISTSVYTDFLGSSLPPGAPLSNS